MSTHDLDKLKASQQVRQLVLGDIVEGEKYFFQVELTEEMIHDFSELTGDVSTLHMDVEFAQSRGFQKRVCHGVLLAGFLSRLVGVHLPGENALLQTMSLKFIAPAYAGMTILVSGEVSQVSVAAKCIMLKTKISDKESGTVLVTAKIQVGITGTGL